MNLQPVNYRTEGLRLRCCRCGEWTPIENVMADLDGVAFIDYYCPACAADELSHGHLRYTK